MTQYNDHHFIQLLPGLPEELALEILTRLHFSGHPVGSQVCLRWRQLLQSTEFYYHRKKSGLTRKVACLVQSLPLAKTELKPAGQLSYGVSVFDLVGNIWTRVDPIPKYPQGMPLFCQVASSEGKLVVMGGCDPVSWEPVRDVFVYEFTTRRWTQCRGMPSSRSFFAVAAAEGRVFVAGGHDESKNALSSAWVFDMTANDWTELTRMSEERDECQGMMMGNEFWVVSGYDTDSQGRFKSSAEAYDLSTGEWRRVDGVWKDSRCPRSCIGARKNNGELVCWGESDLAVRVGVFGVRLGDLNLVTGSEYQGSPQGFFIKRGQNGKLAKIEVPEEFSSFVQSGCCVEI